MSDAQHYRTKDEVKEYQKIDPITQVKEVILEKKYAHALTLRWLTYRLLQNCKRLEKCDSNGKDFMPVLKKELKKFKKLYSNWILTL